MPGYAKQNEDWENVTDFIDQSNVDAWEQAIYELKTNKIDIQDYGADPILSDNSGALQDALDDADTNNKGAIFIHPGEWNLTAPLTINPHDPIHIVGAGRNISTLSWTSDLGLGVPAIDGGTTGDNRNRAGIYDLALFGPDPDSAITMGTSPANMDGIVLAPRMVAMGCRATGFRSGFIISGDHCSIVNCQSSGNYYGLYFTGAGQFDDHYISDFDFTSNAFASIACGPGDRLGGSTLIGGHLGFSPYCFYKEAPQTNDNFIGGCRLIDIAFEGYGNGIIYDEGGDCNVNDNHWIGSDETGGMSGIYSIGARDQDYAVKCGFWSGNYIYGGSGFQDPGDVGVFDCPNWVRTVWWGVGNLVDALDASTVLLTTSGFAEKNRLILDSDTECRVLQNNTGVAENDVLAPTSSFAARKFVAGFDTIVAGVAQHATPNSGWCITATSGRTTINSNGAIAALAYVKPAGADGCVQSDGTSKTLNSIGYSYSAAAAGKVACVLQGVT